MLPQSSTPFHKKKVVKRLLSTLQSYENLHGTYSVPKGRFLWHARHIHQIIRTEKKKVACQRLQLCFCPHEPVTHVVCANTQNNPHFPYLSLLKHTKSKQKPWQDHFASSLSFTSVQRFLYRTYASVCFYVWTEAKVWNEAYTYIKKKVSYKSHHLSAGGGGWWGRRVPGG